MIIRREMKRNDLKYIFLSIKPEVMLICLNLKTSSSSFVDGFNDVLHYSNKTSQLKYKNDFIMGFVWGGFVSIIKVKYI